ncbi:MAG: chemotaxis protein CheX [Planctomycetota bacterium]|nr:MAG: chemotaxis protein CheX [Planctomycetota bacterium]
MKSGLNVDYINPFIEAVVNTFKTMCSVDVQRERIFLKGDGEERYGVTGIIGLGGEASGAVVLNFPEEVAIKSVSSFVGEVYDAINSDVVDGVGELTNIIAGDAKNRLLQKGYSFDIGLPKIVVGRNYVTAQSSSIACIVIQFACSLGKFALEVSLKKN